MQILRKIQGFPTLLILLLLLLGTIGILAMHVTNRGNQSLFAVEPSLQKALQSHHATVVATSAQLPAPAKPKGPQVSISATNLIVTKCTENTAAPAVKTSL